MAAPEAAGLVGRHDERARIDAALRRARDGEAMAVVVTGESGIGKTALLRQSFAGRDDELILLATDGTELDQGAEWSVISRLLPGVVAARAEPFRVGTALLDHVGTLAGQGRVVVVLVDDAHWADPPSLQAIAFLAQRLRAESVLLCLATRPDRLGELPTPILRRAEETGMVQLGGLRRADVVTLAREEYDVSLTGSAAERLRRHTGGSPLHLRALLGTVPASVLNSGTDLPVPESFAALLAGQIRDCSPAARRLLDALAVLGRRTTLHEAAAMSGVPDVRAAADELVSIGLVDVERPGVDRTLAGTSLTIRHGLIRAGVLRELPLAEESRLHAAAAGVLGGPEGLRHRLAAAEGPDEALLAETRDLAVDLEAEGRPMAAARLLRSAAVLLPQGPERTRLMAWVGRLTLEAGGSIDHLRDELDQAPAGPARDYLLGRAAFEAGDTAAAAELLGKAWQAQPADPRLAAAIADTEAVVATSQGRYDEIAIWARRALAEGHGSLNSAVMLFYGAALDQSPVHAARELREIVDRSDESDGGTGARLALGMCLTTTNALEQARAELSAVSVHPQVRGSIQAFVNSRAFLAEAHFRSGDWPRALDLALSTASVVEDADARWMAPLPHGVAASVLAAMGRFDAAHESATAAARTAEGLGVQAQLWAEVAHLRVAEALGDHLAVVAIGERLGVPGIRDLPDWVQRRRPALAAALTIAGRAAEAADLIDHLEVEVATTGDCSLATDTARVRAQWCEARGDRDGARAALEQGLGLDPVMSRPLERARLELAAGAWHRRLGERRTAAALLEASARRLRDLGAQPWLQRCERELVACGLTPVRRSDPPDRMLLTPQETVISHLVASGHSNREIAQELVLSPKTIEFHLSRIYRKLGIRSRSQLAALMTRTEDTI